MGRNSRNVPDVYEASDGIDVRGLTPHLDNEGDVQFWQGYRNGREVTVFND